MVANYYGRNTNGGEQPPTISTGVGGVSLASTEVIDTTQAKETVVINNTQRVAAKALVEEEAKVETRQDLDAEQVASLLSAVGQSGKASDYSIYKWLLALVTVISVAIIGVLLGKRQKNDEEIEILD